MFWFLGFSAVGVVILLVNVWWRRSIAQNYRNLIEELAQKRDGAVIVASSTVKKGKKAADSPDAVLWETNEGFPIDFFHKKKRGAKKRVKMTLKSVTQDSRNRLFLNGVDRKSQEAQHVQLSTLISDIELPVYTRMAIPQFLETVCGIRLEK